MTLLDDIIDASTDASVAAPDLLRRVQVVAHRLGAVDVTQWVKQELAGYATGALLPEYRKQHTPVRGTFAGPMRSFSTLPLTLKPEGFEDMWLVPLRQPLSELQALSQLDEDPGVEWPANAVELYERSGVFRLEYHSLFSARNVLTRQRLAGLIDIVRSKALDFALELQTSFPDAGSLGGPTVATEPGLSGTVFHITNNIYGDGTNVAAGSNIAQRTHVTKGDADALRSAVAEVLVESSDVSEFATALIDAQDVEHPRVAGFVQRVRDGAINIAGSIGVGVAADLLLEIGKAYVGS